MLQNYLMRLLFLIFFTTLTINSKACDGMSVTVVSNIDLGNGTYQLTIQYCEEVSNGAGSAVYGIILDVNGANVISTTTPSFTSSSTGTTINYNAIDGNTVQWGEWDNNPTVPVFMGDGDPEECFTIEIITDSPATSITVAGSSSATDEGSGFVNWNGRWTCRIDQNVPPPPCNPIAPTFDPFPTVCLNDPFVLPTTSTNGQTGTWSPPTANTSAVGTINYTFTASGSGCVGSAVLPLTVESTITPTFDAVPPTCVGASITPLPTTSLNGISGTWSPSINNLVTTTYTFTPTAGGCAIPVDLTITILPDPIVDAGTYTSVCIDAADIALNAASPAGGTWSGTGVTGNNFSPAAGTQTITYTYTDGNNCTASDDVTITIFNLPNISAGNDITICEGQSVTLNGAGGTSYVWTNGEINGQPFTPGVGQATYTVTGTDANGCQNTDDVIVNVFDMPYADVTADSTIGYPGLTVNFDNNSSVTTDYLWNFANGVTGITNNLNPTSSSFNEPGTYNVVLTATNGTCSDYDTVQIIILEFPEPIIEAPNVFTPNGDASNDFFFINTQFTTSISYIIVNRWGNLIFEDEGVNPLWDGRTKNGNPVEEGVYFYKYEILGLNGETYTGHGNVTLIRD